MTGRGGGRPGDDVKQGARALGIAESATDERATLAGAVVRADRVVDGAAFADCTVGGTDATERIVGLVAELDREDLQYLLLGAVAPAWYNLVELDALQEATGLPTIAVTFEASGGLEPALREAFDDDQLQERLERYRSLPPRRALAVGTQTVYVRSVGIDADDADRVVRVFTPEGGRPEPIRVARELARAGAAYRRDDD